MLMQQNEAIPATWPAVPAGLSAAAAALAPALIWGRIEAYTTARYMSRAVVWIVTGEGDWEPPLTPASVTTIEEWSGGAWVAAMLEPSPLGGYVLPAIGPYRFTGTAGGGAVPAAVSEAYRRLAEYMAATDDAPAGASDYAQTLGPITESFTRPPAWLGRAMINSGAADLLRPYRRAG